MDLDKLRLATRVEHEATEGVMPRMDASLTRAEYVSMLRRLHPVVRSWEQWALAHAPKDLLPTLEGRQRAGLIERDLDWLEAEGAERESAPQAAARPFPAGQIPGLTAAGQPGFRASFLGAMYVMEGSTLGGQYIARHVEEVLGFGEGEGSAYFRGYGERTGSMWRAFKAVLAELPERDAADAVAAAKAMFRVFRTAMTA